MSGSPSPTASIESATASNPNTQYTGELAVSDLQSDDFNSVSSDEVAINASHLSSSLSRPQDSNIKPTLFNRLDETRIYACARWDPNQNIDDISLNIHWAGQYAFIKLYARLRLENAPGTSQRNRRNVYLFIDPERIHQLLFTAQPNNIPYGCNIALTFHLNRLPALILPKTSIGFTQEAQGTICSLHGLAQQSCFTIYARLSQRRIPHKWLRQFCKDITEHKFTSIPRLANWKTLYKGSKDAAEMIEGDSLLEHVIERDDAAISRLSPYQEKDLPLTQSTKKKRFYDKSSAIGQSVQDTAAVQPLNEVLDAKLAAHQRKLEDIFSARERKLEEMFSTYKRELKEISAHMEEVEELENGLTHRIDKSIDDKLDAIVEAAAEAAAEILRETPMYFAR